MRRWRYKEQGVKAASLKGAALSAHGDAELAERQKIAKYALGVPEEVTPLKEVP